MSRITLLQSETIRRGVRFTGRFCAEDGSPVDVSYTFEQAPDAAQNYASDAFLLTFLLPAMRVGEPLHIEAEVDAELLEHLDQVQRYWHTWCPQIFRRITITADGLRATEGVLSPQAISCFSGGVDSCYTALKHSGLFASTGDKRLPLTRLLMVHGMDIPLEDTAVFDRAYDRSVVLARALGAGVSRAATDVRHLGRLYEIDWGVHLHGFALAACLMFHQGAFGYGIIINP